MKRWIAPFAIAMVVLYAVLAVGASGCLILHSGQPSSAHHHSQSHLAHSALCAWACQANPSVILNTIVPLSVLLLIVAILQLVSVTPQTELFASFFHSRAPPR